MVKNPRVLKSGPPGMGGRGRLHQKCKSCKMHHRCCCTPSYLTGGTMHAQFRKSVSLFHYIQFWTQERSKLIIYVKRRSHTPLRLRKQTIFDHCMLALQKRSCWGIFSYFFVELMSLRVFFYISILDWKFKNAKSLTQFTFLGLFD